MSRWSLGSSRRRASRHRAGGGTSTEPVDAEPAGEVIVDEMVEEPAALAPALPEPTASLSALFFEQVAAAPSREAFRHRTAGNEWQSLTWSQTAAAVTEIAAGLIWLGIEAQDRVAIACGVRLEWILADIGVLCAGAATVDIDPAATVEEVRDVLSQSDSRVVIVEDAGQLAKVTACWDDLPGLSHVVLMDWHGMVAAGTDEHIVMLEYLRRQGKVTMAADPQVVERTARSVQPGHPAAFAFTSASASADNGDATRREGLRLNHSELVRLGLAVETGGVLTRDELQYVCLQPADPASRVLLGCQLRVGFATAVDGDVDALVDNFAALRPTLMAATPAIFEKAQGESNEVVAALVRLDPEAIWTWSRGQEGLPQKWGYVQIVRSPAARRLLETHIDEMKTRLGRWDTVNHYEAMVRGLVKDGAWPAPATTVRRRAVEVEGGQRGM